MKRMNVKQLMGAFAEWMVIIVVAAYLAINSLDFWIFVTPPDKPLVAYLGFGLTGGGMIAYLAILMWRADTNMKKFIAIGMLAVCTIGELLTAGFGMQIEGWKKIGLTFTATEFSTMTIIVQVLALLHALAMIVMIAGDALARAFADDDRDGIPNWKDKHDNRPQNNQQKQSQFQQGQGRPQGASMPQAYNSETKAPPPEQENPTKGR
jgi:hypothetical protein